MAKNYKSEAMAAIHETMEGLYESGAIDKQTMRDFDEACLTTLQPLAPEEIRAIREREHLSQPVFARYLNVSKGLVSDWERGVKKPGGPALKLLTVIQKKGVRAIA
ncbi:transcriptional regulator [Brucella endophytica]|uniref:Transcriptional regulator n=1 Tax=Brucella endophytica TaxID=1963359 RepID=A0A916WAZ2_9HYPH|nr:DNA-binding transcriptional regulator [Brucella endophytica]GGA81749.1 transcriptional regulator [Brucella endophytica]